MWYPSPRLPLGRGGRRGYSIFMHGRSRKTIDPRIPTTGTGTEHVRFSPTTQRLLAPSAERREVLGESHDFKG